MNFKSVGRTIGQILLVECVFMIPPMLLSAMDGDERVLLAFFCTIVMEAGFGLMLIYVTGTDQEGLFAQEGFVTVALCWIVMSLLGSLPFYFSGEIPRFVDALFETISGFTTTGASILSEVEPMSRGLLFWRSFTHWLGGMGMLVFTLAVVPANKDAGGTLHLMRAESPGPDVGKFTPRIRRTAVILYQIYIGLTVLCLLFLLLGGMPLFDALCTAFGTAGTGGFGIKNDSLAGYSPYLQNVCTVFMLLFGVNFNIYYLLLLRRVGAVLKDEELRWYLFLFMGATLLITWDILPRFRSLGASFHHAAFQVSSIMTTTGFSTVDFNLWPPFSKAILLCMMVLGACAGSTGGGIKTIRAILLMKDMKRNVATLLNPRSVKIIHVSGQPVEDKVLRGVGAYMAAYWMLLLLSLLVVSLDEHSVETNLSAVMACFNNIGPGFGAVGPMTNYGHFSALSKLVLSADMLLGRLEIFPILALFSRGSWSRSK